jgi:molybdopterin-containing oxidoreductase family membrane subunit
MREYLQFLLRVIRISFYGDWRFYAWMSFLTVLVLVGLHAWARQFVEGLQTTGLTNQVSWGAYIANFTFLVGVAAAAVMLVIPAYVYRQEHMHEVVVFGELMAIAVILMCLSFVMVDLGHPERFHHMIPPFGIFNFPGSILSWDVIVLNGYLLLNLHIAGYLLYCRYRGCKPARPFYIPFVFISIVWAISIHTVTAFLYVGLAGRSYWHHPLVPSRFLASAFVAGPALMILTFQIIRRVTQYHIGDRPLHTLRMIMTVAMIINMFLLGCEVFTEFYFPTQHAAAAEYLYFGLHGHRGLVPWIWTAIGLDTLGLLLLITPAARRIGWLNLACVACFVGIWIEKGMGLIVPGFVPTPLGQVVEYLPTWKETLVCLGIWALGALLYSWMLRVAVPIMSGALRARPPAGEPISEARTNATGKGQPWGA